MSKNSRLVFLPLGGTGEIGMNMNLYGYGNEIDDMKWLIVDVGITFGDDTTPGVDVILPDHEFIKERKENLQGIIITHAHEDHVGGLAYLWPDLKCPIYATAFTASIIRLKFEERGINIEDKLNIVDLSSEIQIKPFDIKFQTLTHSIPEPNSLFIKTKLGTIYHTGDWKIDDNPIVGDSIDFNQLKENSEEVLAMVCDSTNVLTSGRSGSESTVRGNLAGVIKKLKNRVFVTSFASNVARLETIAAAAKESGRSLVVLGRSMHRMISVARQNGILKDIDVILSEKDAAKKKKHEVLYLCTGSQGEPRGAMMRISNQDFPHIDIDQDDCVIFSSKIIPGNEKKIFKLFNRLSELGAEVITEYDEDIHVSGHPCLDEMVDMYEHVKPKISVPVHGEFRHLKRHSSLAKELGVQFPMQISNGDILQLAPGSPYIYDQCKSGRQYLDGNRLVDYNSSHIKDRKRMSYNGVLNITCVLDKKMNLKNEPVIFSSGILSDDEYDSDEVINILEEEIYKFFDDKSNISKKEKKIYQKLETLSRNLIYKHSRKKPLTNISIVHI
ncbi:ribonuclease J [Pelagibacterales bacterium SAG-MED32]|nr:ribonuclease J [Pelagibacterales bacterium SAG-MED32]